MKQKQKPSLSWTALRQGNYIYCAPACGGQCTWKAYQIAKVKADLLATSLGPQWIPHVWENLGWHYSVGIPGGCRLEIHDTSHGRPQPNYTVFLHNMYVTTDTDVRRALKTVLKMAERDMTALKKVTKKAKGALLG